MKLILTGAQGTGKTTILNHFKDTMPVITEVVRKLAKQGININEYGDADGQKLIFDTYQKLLSETPEYMSDRGLTDVLAYTGYLFDSKKIEDETVVFDQAEALGKFNSDHPDVIYFYFPIEFPVVDDGTRSIDENFRKAIDQNILGILKLSGVPYIEVRGTVEERIKIVESVILIESQK